MASSNILGADATSFCWTWSTRARICAGGRAQNTRLFMKLAWSSSNVSIAGEYLKLEHVTRAQLSDSVPSNEKTMHIPISRIYKSWLNGRISKTLEDGI